MNLHLRRDRLLRLLWAGPVALGVCYFALWACAPVFTQPPPVPIANDQNREIGLSGGSALEFGADNPCDDGLLHTRGCNGPQLQAYYRSWHKKVEITAIAHGGYVSLAGAGLQLRGYFARTDRFHVGLTGSVGWLWGGAGIPVAGALTDSVWIYTEPTFALAILGMVRVPVGVSWDVGKGMGLGLEGGVFSGANSLRPVPYGNFRISAAF